MQMIDITQNQNNTQAFQSPKQTKRPKAYVENKQKSSPKANVQLLMTSEWENQLNDCDFQSPKNANQFVKNNGSWSDDEEDIFDKNLQYAPIKAQAGKGLFYTQNVYQRSDIDSKHSHMSSPTPAKEGKFNFNTPVKCTYSQQKDVFYGQIEENYIGDSTAYATRRQMYDSALKQSASKFLFRDDQSCDSILNDSDSGSDGQFPLRIKKMPAFCPPEMQIVGDIKHEHFESDSEDQVMESDSEMEEKFVDNKCYKNSQLAPHTFSLQLQKKNSQIQAQYHNDFTANQLNLNNEERSQQFQNGQYSIVQQGINSVAILNGGLTSIYQKYEPSIQNENQNISHDMQGLNTQEINSNVFQINPKNLPHNFKEFGNCSQIEEQFMQNCKIQNHQEEQKCDEFDQNLNFGENNSFTAKNFR